MSETYIPRNSSHIAQAEYDREERSLTITFQSGDVYEYDEVPFDVFLGLQNAASAGQYFHRVIKDRFAYEQV